MKPFVIPLSGMLAVGALIVADLFPALKVVEASLVLQLSKTTWGGGERLWIAAGLMTLATIFWAVEARRWPAFLSGAALGILIDIGISAWQWRGDELARLSRVGLGDFQPTIEWDLGSVGYGTAALMMLIFFVKSAYPSKPPKQKKDVITAQDAIIEARMAAPG